MKNAYLCVLSGEGTHQQGKSQMWFVIKAVLTYKHQKKPCAPVVRRAMKMELVLTDIGDFRNDVQGISLSLGI